MAADPEAVEALADDLHMASPELLVTVAEWMLGHGWTEPLDSAPRPDDMTAAWAAAEAALPEGWRMRVSMQGDLVLAEAWDHGNWTSTGSIDAFGPTPAAALWALEARLREVRRA